MDLIIPSMSRETSITEFMQSKQSVFDYVECSLICSVHKEVKLYQQQAK